MIVSNDNYLCSNCGGRNISNCESQIPGVNMRNWLTCKCCNLLIKRNEFD